MAQRNPLAEFAGGVAGFLSRRSERRQKEEETAKLRQSLAGVTTGLQSQATLEQQLAAGVPLARAQATTKATMKEFVPEEDPRYKYLTAQKLDPTTILNLARFLYQAKPTPGIILGARRVQASWSRAKKTAYEKWKKEITSRERQLSAAQYRFGDPVEIQALKDKVASWERQGVAKGFLKAGETIYTTQFKEEREARKGAQTGGSLPGLTP